VETAKNADLRIRYDNIPLQSPVVKIGKLLGCVLKNRNSNVFCVWSGSPPNVLVLLTTAVTSVLVCGLQRCRIRQGTNQNIKCTCAKVRCLVLGQHIICKCPCTKFLARFSHTQHHIWPNFERICLKETMKSDGGDIFWIFLFCLKLILCIQYVSCIVGFFLFGATAPSGPGPPHSQGF